MSNEGKHLLDKIKEEGIRLLYCVFVRVNLHDEIIK